MGVVYINNIIYISDTVHGTIQISQIEKKIISTSIFNRLHNISQNSTAYLTFPTNRTKRFEHSIGTMHLAGKMFYSSIANAESDILKDFFNNLRTIINERIEVILKDRLYKHELGDKNFKRDKLKSYDKFTLDNNIKNIWLPSNVEKNDQFLYLVVMQAIRLAALLHDVGHPPFSHIAENALRDVWKSIDNKLNGEKKEEINKSEKKYYDILSKYFENNGELHEKIGNNITDRLFQSLIDTIPKKQMLDEKIFENQEFLLMLKEMTTSILNEKKPILKNLHKLIDGSLDCDRLDYVSRDVVNSGFNNGIIEYDRMISSMKLLKNSKNEFIFCPQMKVINNIEDFFSRRWNLYTQIIFHHRVIKTDYLLYNCIKELIEKYLKNDSSSEMVNNILPYDISGLWLAVEGDPSDDVFFNQLIQWDDSWLMVVLKKEFLSIPEEEKNEELKLLRNKLNELLANEKYYYSLIKKQDNFVRIENEAISYMKSKVADLESSMNIIKSSKSEFNGEDTQLNIDPFLNDLENLINKLKNCTISNSYSHSGFILSRIKNLIFGNYISEQVFKDIVRVSVEDAAKNDTNIESIIVEFKNIKLGIQEGLMLYSSNGDCQSFRNKSNMIPLLLFQREFLPPFYVYLAKKDIDVEVNYDKLKAEIGKNLGEKIIIKLEQFMEEYK